jgi:hypothetical protein
MGLFKKVTDASHRIGDDRPSASSMMASLGARTAPDDLADKLRFAQLLQKVMAAGVDAPAVINAIKPGADSPLGSGIDTVFEVTIKPPNGDAYATTIRQSMQRTALDGMSVGDAISIRYDPDDPKAAIILAMP